MKKEIAKADFYKIETTIDGKSFVTARGWSDLSYMIKLYELQNISVDEKLIGQYLQNRKIAKDFAVYYDLYNKYKSDYQIDMILEGNTSEDIKERARKARFDERLSLLGLLIDGATSKLKDVFDVETSLLAYLDALKHIKMQVTSSDDIFSLLARQMEQKEKMIAINKQAGTLSKDNEYAERSAILLLEEQRKILSNKGIQDGTEGLNSSY